MRMSGPALAPAESTRPGATSGQSQVSLFVPGSCLEDMIVEGILRAGAKHGVHLA
jgi:hypothetical protein